VQGQDAAATVRGFERGQEQPHLLVGVRPADRKVTDGCAQAIGLHDAGAFSLKLGIPLPALIRRRIIFVPALPIVHARIGAITLEVGRHVGIRRRDRVGGPHPVFCLPVEAPNRDRARRGGFDIR
jgi:hypothetical protein